MERQTIRKETFGARFSALLHSSGENTYTVAEKLGLTPGTISRYANGIMAPKLPTLRMIADMFRVNPLWLMGQDAPKYTQAQGDALPLPEAFPISPTRKVPLLGHIAAGLPLFAEENIEGWLWTDQQHGGEYFGLRVRGDSMNAAGIKDGDTLIVRKQDIVEEGAIAVVLVDDSATVKRYHRSGGTVILTPQSTNPEHQPQIYRLKEHSIRVLGRIVECRTAY